MPTLSAQSLAKPILATISNYRRVLGPPIGACRPVTRNLPETWYMSPDAHLCSIADFDDLCKVVNAEVEQAVAFNSWGRRLPINRSILLQNVFGEKAVFLLKQR